MTSPKSCLLLQPNTAVLLCAGVSAAPSGRLHPGHPARASLAGFDEEPDLLPDLPSSLSDAVSAREELNRSAAANSDRPVVG